jgi:hypothetical protein
MPENTDPADLSAGQPESAQAVPAQQVAARVRHAGAGLTTLLAEAEQVWVARARDPQAAAPGWRPFEDAFPTFYQFTNRPR